MGGCCLHLEVHSAAMAAPAVGRHGSPRRPTDWPSAAGAPCPEPHARPAQFARNQMERAIPRSAGRPWAARDLNGRPSASTRVPKRKDLDATSFRIGLVVQVVASPAEKEAANPLFLGVARSRSDTSRSDTGKAAMSSKARSRSSAKAKGAAGRFARHHAEARRISSATRGGGGGLTAGRTAKGY